MLESYFFIPADKDKYMDNIANLRADHYVFDLEDAVAPNQKQTAYKKLIERPIKENYFVRIPLNDNSFSSDQITKLLHLFNGNIVVPKVDTKEQIDILVSLAGESTQLNLVISVESPVGYFNINQILSAHRDSIFAIGFGTHDFCTCMEMKHTSEQLNPYRKQLILLAKVFGIGYIDGVNLQITETEEFNLEVRYAFEAGANGKFIIHPRHLNALNQTSFYSDNEIKKMRKVYTEYQKLGKKGLDILTLDGAVYEKPHILKIETILNKLDNNSH